MRFLYVYKWQSFMACTYVYFFQKEFLIENNTKHSTEDSQCNTRRGFHKRSWKPIHRCFLYRKKIWIFQEWTKYHLWSYAKIFHFSNIRSIPLNELNKLHTWLDEQRYKWFALRKFILANFPQSVGENPIMFSNFIAYLHRQPLPHNCINVQGEFRHGIENTTLCSPFFIWCSEKELFKHVWLHLSEYKKTFKSL